MNIIRYIIKNYGLLTTSVRQDMVREAQKIGKDYESLTPEERGDIYVRVVINRAKANYIKE